MSANEKEQASGSRGQILVVISSEHTLTLQNGKTYPTGYFLNELCVPVKIFMDHGYNIVFSNPKGNLPSSDINSETAFYFGGSEARCQEYKQFRDTLIQLKTPIKTLDVVAGGLDKFDAVFFPGGHAPILDLTSDPGVFKILNYFHKNSMVTSLICHGCYLSLGSATKC